MTATVFCGACGAEIPRASLFCTACGENQKAFMAEPAPTRHDAPARGAEHEPQGRPPEDERPNEESIVLIGIRALEDGNLDPARYGLMTPIPGAAPDTVVVEPRDGDRIQQLTCRDVEAKIAGAKKPFFKAPEIRCQVLVTDARIAFACSKYDKGGGWFGGPAAIALNAGSKVLAARRRRGRMMVGHVRYPWLSAVYARNRGGVLGSEMLRLAVRSPLEEGTLLIDLELPKDVDAIAVATEVIRRAASFRLRCEPELTVEERDELAELAQLEGLTWKKGDKELAGVSFGSWWPIGEHSARLGLTTVGTA